MDRQFDFRALLLQIQDRLSDDDRGRFHFLVGDIIPRHQRDDHTLRGTLTLLESLFDRALISEDYMDFLIRIFREIQCYDAVKRLQEYQLAKQPPVERKLTVTDMLIDNCDEDKHPTTTYEPLISVTSNSTSLSKPDVRKLTISDEPFEKPPVNIQSKQTQTKFFKSPLIICLYILFLSQILILIIYLLFFFYKKSPIHSIEHKIRQDVYILKTGKSLDNLTGKWFNHAENLSLTFADRLIHIDAYSYYDDLYSIKFIYSQNKSIEHKLRNITRLNQPNRSSLDFKNSNIEKITQCYKNNNGSQRLVGLRFGLKDTLFGSCYEQIPLIDIYSKHTFSYARSKSTQYLNGFQFIWYKICRLNNEVMSCVESNLYVLPLSAFYKD